MEDKRIILSHNKALEKAQRELIEQLKPRLNDVLTTFNRLNLGNINIENLSKIDRNSGAEVVKAKAIVKFANTKIGEVNINPLKAYEMADIDSSEFVDRWNETKEFIENYILRKGYENVPGVCFNIAFFTIVKDSVSVNSEYFQTWITKKCFSYTENEVQVEVYKQTLKLCDTLNKLIKIKRSKITDNNGWEFTTEKLQHSAGDIMKNSEGPLYQMLIWENNKFDVRKEFVLRH